MDTGDTTSGNATWLFRDNGDDNSTSVPENVVKWMIPLDNSSETR